MRTLLAFLLAVTITASSGADSIGTIANKVLFRESVKDGLIHIGLPLSLCAAQSLTGIVEGHKFGHGDTYHSTSKDYHVYRYAQDVAWLSAGWFASATIRQKSTKWTTKLRRGLGAVLLARNAYEWSYKWNRYNNPFDYTKHRNERALVYVKFQNGHLVDAFIGLGPASGPIVDAVVTVAGIWLLR